MSERLVQFLYTLARDTVSIGTVESLMWDQVIGGATEVEYCNPWLEAWARELTVRLTDESVPVTNYNNMYKPAVGPAGDEDFKVLGVKAKEHDAERPPYPIRSIVVLSDTV